MVHFLSGRKMIADKWQGIIMKGKMQIRLGRLIKIARASGWENYCILLSGCCQGSFVLARFQDLQLLKLDCALNFLLDNKFKGHVWQHPD